MTPSAPYRDPRKPQLEDFLLPFRPVPRFALRAGDSFAHALDNTTVSAWARRASFLHARSYGRGAPLPTLPSDRHTSRVRKLLASPAPSMPPLTENENQGQRREARRLYR